MKSLLIDSNVLVFSLVETCRENPIARSRLDSLLSQGLDFAVCPQVIHESYSVLTRRYEIAPEQADEWLSQVLQREEIEFLEPGFSETRLALELAARKGLKGLAFYDACLAALIMNMRIDGILTDNVKDFERLGIGVKPMRDGKSGMAST